MGGLGLRSGEEGGGVDVSVIMLPFQQSKSYEKLEVPQIQLIVGVLTFQLCRRDRYPQCCPSCSRCSSWRLSTCPLFHNDRYVQLQCVDKVVNIPVVAQRLIDSLLQCVDKVVNVLVVRVVQVPRMLVVEVVQIPQLQLAEKIVCDPPVLGQGCCMPVGVQQQVLGVTVLKTAVSPQLQFVDEVVVFPVVAQRQIPMMSLFR